MNTDKTDKLHAQVKLGSRAKKLSENKNFIAVMNDLDHGYFIAFKVSDTPEKAMELWREYRALLRLNGKLTANKANGEQAYKTLNKENENE